MKPRNKYEKGIIALSKTLRPLTTPQRKYAILNAMPHIAKRSSKGVFRCLECNHEWKVKSNDVPENRQEWIDRYLSVSYPLNKIHITSQFGNRKDPFTGKKANHCGLDLRAKYEEVYAMMYGQVIKVGNDKRSGNYITIRGCVKMRHTLLFNLL